MEPFSGILPQAHHHHLFEIAGNLGEQLGRERGRRLDMVDHDLEVAVVFEGNPSREQLEHDDAKGIEVGAGIDGFATNLFRRHVVNCSDKRPGSRKTLASLDLRYAKIHDFGDAFGCEEYVGWFQVPVNHAEAMRCRQALEYLLGECNDNGGWKSPKGAHEFRQAFSVDELHHHVERVAVRHEVIESDYVWIAQARLDFCLRPEPLEFSAALFHEAWIQDFDGHFAPELRVFCLINRSHAALAKLGDYFVIPDGFADHRLVLQSWPRFEAGLIIDPKEGGSTLFETKGQICCLFFNFSTTYGIVRGQRPTEKAEFLSVGPDGRDVPRAVNLKARHVPAVPKSRVGKRGGTMTSVLPRDKPNDRKERNDCMHRPMKYMEKALTVAAGTTFDLLQFFNKRKANPSFTPKWSDRPLQKSWRKSKPPLGWPRTTDSLCPRCVIEAREKIFRGEEEYRVLVNDRVGEIKATILERDGQIWMVKECPKHICS